MNTNHVICRNEVYIEDVYVGQFESFQCQASARTLGNTAVLTMPLYALASDGTGKVTSRFRAKNPDSLRFYNYEPVTIKVCSEVKVYVWYDSWNAIDMKYESFPKVLAFSGFVEHIAEGYPAKLYLQDNSFILRFGAIEKAWNEDATIQKILADCVPIAQAAFDEERKRLKFDREIPRLTYSAEQKNVQAITTSLSFRNWAGRSPYDTVQKLMQLMVLYGGVSNNFNVYVGTGTTESTRTPINLSTQTNVIDRNLVPIDGRFVDYDVKVVGILKDGKQYSATGGYRTSKSKSEQSSFEKEYGGETVRFFSSLTTVKDLQGFADEMLKMLRENRNKGEITLLLYPKIEIMDWVSYTDTVFEKMSSGYYVLEYNFNASEKGYFQTLGVSDKVFAL